MKYRCLDCGHVGEPGASCPSCGSDRYRKHEPPPAPKPAPPQAAADRPKDLSEDIRAIPAPETDRIKFGMPEVERVLGGGLLPKLRVAICGEPGIGKSTLLMAISARVARACKNRKGAVLYVTGEESKQAISRRAKRTGKDEAGLRVLQTKWMDEIEASVAALRPTLVIFDSVSTFYNREDPGMGKVQRIEWVQERISEMCEKYGCAAFEIAHVTKDGEMGGPKTFEHFVDVTTVFDGDRTQDLRYFRVIKNREGAGGEVATLEMTNDGLIEIPDAAEQLIKHRAKGEPGSVIFPTTDVGRACLMEIEAKVSGESEPDAEGKVTGPLPRVPSIAGLIATRVPRLITLLSESLQLTGATIHLEANRVGNAAISDEAADLAVAAAIASSRIQYVFPEDTVVAGVVTVTGRVKPVDRLRARLDAALKAGFKQAIIPASQLDDPSLPKGIHLIGIEHLRDLTPWLIRNSSRTKHAAKTARPADSYLIATEATEDGADPVAA